MPERRNDPTAARVDHDALRRTLRSYVTAWLKDRGDVDAKMLADLVVAAPAFQTLDANEWWNVALILAFEVRDAAK